MRITLELFAVLREIAGTGSVDLDLPEGSRAIDAWQILRARHSALASLAEPPMTAVNEEYSPHDVLLQDGDRVAFIPPVSGG